MNAILYIKPVKLKIQDRALFALQYQLCFCQLEIFSCETMKLKGLILKEKRFTRKIMVLPLDLL